MRWWGLAIGLLFALFGLGKPAHAQPSTAKQTIVVYVRAAKVTKTEPSLNASGTFDLKPSTPLHATVSGLEGECRIYLDLLKGSQVVLTFDRKASELEKGVELKASEVGDANGLSVRAKCGTNNIPLIGSTSSAGSQNQDELPQGDTDGKACFKVESTGPLQICPSRLRGDTNRSTGAPSFGIDAVVTDVLQVIAEVAAERAKRKGIDLVRSRVEATLCTLEDPKGTVVLQQTCAIVRVASLNDLAAEAKALRRAIAADLLSYASRRLEATLGGSQKNLVQLVGVLVPLLQASFDNQQLALPDPKASLDVLVSQDWSANGAHDIWRDALASVRECLVRPECSERTLRYVGAHPEAIVLAQMMVRIALPDQNVSARDRWRTLVELVDWLARHNAVPELERTRLHSFLTALVESDVANAISSGASLFVCGATQPEDVCREQKRGMRALSTIAAFAATYEEQAATTSANGKSADTALTEARQKQLHETRKALVQQLIDENTDRASRETDTIFSIGANVGFMAGGQMLRNASGELGATELMAPQLSLPFGVSLDLGLAKYAGFHFMLYPFDLGQYAAYTGEKGLNAPRWDTALVAGGQVAFMFGQNTPLMVGVSGQYSPTLFAQNGDTDLTSKAGGALRFGAFVAYYIPFFDFN